jgi:hypothetical protein
LICKSAAEADVAALLLLVLANSDKSNPPAKQASNPPFLVSRRADWAARARLEVPDVVVVMVDDELNCAGENAKNDKIKRGEFYFRGGNNHGNENS